MSRAAEADAWNDQQIVFFGALAECHIVFLQCPWEHIEGSARLNHMESQVTESCHEQILVGLVDRGVRGHIRAHGTYSLEQAGSIYIAQRPSGSGDGRIDEPVVVHLIRNDDIAHTFARKGEGFGPGIANQCVL